MAIGPKYFCASAMAFAAATVFALYGLEPVEPPTGIPLGSAPPDRAVRVISEDDFEIGVVRGPHQLTYRWDGTRADFHKVRPSRGRQ